MAMLHNVTLKDVRIYYKVIFQKRTGFSLRPRIRYSQLEVRLKTWLISEQDRGDIVEASRYELYI